MNQRFNRNWSRKNDEGFSLGILPFFILILVAFGFKSIAPESNLSDVPKVKIDLPEGERFQKLIQSRPILYLYVGKPNSRSCFSGSSRLQINDKISSEKDIHLAVFQTNKNWLYDNHPIRAELRADKNLTMGFIMDIKRELQKINWVHFNYIQAKKTE